MFPRFCLIAFLLMPANASTAIAVVSAEPAELVEEALRQREMHDYAAAIATLRSAETASAGDRRIQLLLAETLSWNREFDEAASRYEALRQSGPHERETLLGLARVRLWQGLYVQARDLFDQLLEIDPRDAAAAEGRATADYWSGDWRRAQREFRTLVAAHPERSDSRKMLSEIERASRPALRATIDETRDDQPFRVSRSVLSASRFTDPLTRWDVTAGVSRLSSVEKRANVPFALAGNETVFPPLRLTAGASLGAVRTPDGVTHPIGSAVVRFALPHSSSLAVSASNREILTNATQLFPRVRSVGLRWQHDGNVLASAGAEALHYSDRNRGTGADAYILVPVVKRSAWRLQLGVSAAYRDTVESRFYLTRVTGESDPAAGFRYIYDAAYNPYWTPHDLREARFILAAERRFGDLVEVRLHADAGRTSDDAVTFWPSSGNSPFPPLFGTSTYHRTYNPRKIRVTASITLRWDMSIDAAAEHSVTAFYESNSFHVSLGRHL